MRANALLSLIAVCVAGSSAAGPLGSDEAGREPIRDLYFGEALYYAHQGDYFDALGRLDTELGQYYDLDEPLLDAFHFHVDDAEFSVGDFELRYRMHHRAGRAITAVLEGAVDESVRNDAAYRLARIHFQKGQLEDALHALDRIEGRVPEAIRDDVEFLWANVYMGLGRHADATDVLRRLQGEDGLTGFSEYNLGIALLEDGRTDDAFEQLDRAGRVDGGDETVLAIRDRSNFVLGTLLVENGRYGDAMTYFERVRLDGPFSNSALLSAGWAAVAAERFDRAVVPWGILAEREVTDAAVQEALLALPYAYGELAVHGRAAVLYAGALDSFGQEVEKLDASIESIREGRFLAALVREEVRQDADWEIRLRSLPESPETYYLIELMASHDFQTALQNYLDLEDLRRRLASWVVNFDAFEDIVALRSDYYEPRLPEVDSEFRELDSRMRLRIEQHGLLAKRLEDMLVAPRPKSLATAEERALGARLDQLAAALDRTETPEAEALRARVRRLQGILTFTLHTEYHDRLNTFALHLEELGEAIGVLNTQYDAFVRTRQAAVHSFEGYDTPISRMRTRVAEALASVNLLMARQGRALEVLAIDELLARRERLAAYQDEARFALADSYDRATKARADAEVAAAQEAQTAIAAADTDTDADTDAGVEAAAQPAGEGG